MNDSFDLKDPVSVKAADSALRPLVADKRWLSLDHATQRLKFRDTVSASGYSVDSLEDIHITTVVAINVQLVHGHLQYMQAQDLNVLDAFPAQELYRAGNFFKKKLRDWKSRWIDAGGQTFGADRMIALAGDPVWIKSSIFSVPYPPFDFDSGMWVKPVSLGEAIEFGIISKEATVLPDPTSYPPPFVSISDSRLMKFVAYKVAEAEEEYMVVCTRCGVKGSDEEIDCCEKCRSDLCPDCMKKGCCGSVPAESAYPPEDPKIKPKP